MAFAEHMRRMAEDALARIPAEVKAEIYLVGVRIDGAEQDPRRPYLALGYNTESHYRYEMEHQSSPDPLEVRWLYAHWMLDVEREAFIGHHETDPEGTALLIQEAERLGVRYPGSGEETGGAERAVEGDADDEAEPAAEERLASYFDDLCVDLARYLHESGRLEEILGRPVPIVLYDMFRGDAEIALTRAANPPELLTGFLSFYRAAGCV